MDQYQSDTLTLKLVSTFILTACILAILYFVYGFIYRDGCGQWLNVQNHRHGIRCRAGGTGAGLDIRGSRLRSLYHPQGIWRANQGDDTGVCPLWFCDILRGMPRVELVVLFAAQCVCKKPLMMPLVRLPWSRQILNYAHKRSVSMRFVPC